MALTSKGDLEAGEIEDRPMFGLEAHKKGGEKGASAKVYWPLNKAGVHVFI